MADTLQRLPDEFIWSSSGRRHVEYAEGESFEGDLGTFLGQDDLGQGGQATVQVVVVKGKIVARKRMLKEGVEEARREAHILEHVKHRHIIQLVGTYTLSRRLYLLLYPIAECTIKEYINRPIAERDLQWETQLKECFGCLANTVAFLHSKQIAIKHKDLKPSNILMFSGQPIITDFGISNSFKDKDHSKSSGVTGKSEFYAAPEVIRDQERNTSQDIFSLGLVFLDMYWSLKGKSYDRTDFHGARRREAYAGTILDAADIRFAGNILKAAFEEAPSAQEDVALLRIIRLMTAVELENRPTADTIWTVFQYPTCFGRACGECCLKEVVPDSTVFTQWSGLHTYIPRHPRGPYDRDLHHNMSPEDRTIRQDDEPDLATLIPRPDSTALWDWTGQNMGFHVDGEAGDIVPMRHIKSLGAGGSGMVEAVECNGRVIARKTLRVPRPASRHANILQMFQVEVSTMRRLQHYHIIQVVGSYSNQRSLSMLTYPVCQYDMRRFIDECQDLRGQQSHDAEAARRARWIRLMTKKSAQCLAQALDYLHENGVRHGDIKPQNILFRTSADQKTAHVYLTDFGISKLVDDLTDTGTVGTPGARTLKYSAPEFDKFERRGRSIDVFSLGCVFYEILELLLCTDVVQLEHRSYARNLDMFHDHVKGYRNHTGIAEGLRIPRGQICRFADLILEMTREDPGTRPPSSAVAQRLGPNDCCYLEPEDIADDENSALGVKDREISDGGS